MLDVINLRDQLRAAGWDAIASTEATEAGEVAARLDRPATGGVWTLVVDGSGRCRFTATRETAMPEGGKAQRGPWTFRWLRERQEILTIGTHLSRVEDLPGVLAELHALAVAEEAKTP